MNLVKVVAWELFQYLLGENKGGGGGGYKSGEVDTRNG